MCLFETINKIKKNNARANLGKHISLKQKKYLSNLYKGKTWEELYGKEKANKMKNNLSKNNPRYWKGKHCFNKKSEELKWNK